MATIYPQTIDYVSISSKIIDASTHLLNKKVYGIDKNHAQKKKTVMMSKLLKHAFVKKRSTFLEFMSLSISNNLYGLTARETCTSDQTADYHEICYCKTFEQK